MRGAVYCRRARLALMLAGALAAPPAWAEEFTLDPAHTSVNFKINHLGISETYGRFNDVEGRLDLDRQNPEASSVTVVIDTRSIDTNHEERDDHLRGEEFFAVGTYPTITFKSTDIEMTGEKTAKITGDLTLRGVTKPLALDATLLHLGPHPMRPEREVAGFTATGEIRRSDYGMTGFLPMVGDEVTLFISAEAYREAQGPAEEAPAAEQGEEGKGERE